jgi:hypothetical protein
MDSCNIGKEDGAGQTVWQNPSEYPGSVACVKPQSGRELLKSFFSLTGGSVFYCLSAASIIYGIGQIISPTLGKSILLSQTLPCLLAINLYELALLGVLVVIVRFRNVTDDAISLLVLIALFLVTSGLTLGTLTPGDPQKCFYIGLVCAVLGLVKLSILKYSIHFPIRALSLVGLTFILLWIFLAAPLMGKPFATGDWPEELRRGDWLLWWFVLLAGGSFVLLEAILYRPVPAWQNIAFIRRPVMVWIVTLVLMAAAVVYQKAITYMYVIDSVWGDYLPVCVVFLFLLIELLRGLTHKLEYLRIAISIIPLAATIYAILDKQIISYDTSFQMLWHPPVMLGLTGILVLVLAFYHRWTSFFYVALVYALGVLLTFGYSAQKPFDLNWELFAGIAVAILFVLGIVKQNIQLCFGAVVLLAGGLGSTAGLEQFAHANDLTVPGAVTGIAGLGIMVICIIFGQKVNKGIILFGSFCLMFCVFDYLPASLAWEDLVIVGGLILLCAVIWYRTKTFFMLPILCIPFIPKLILFWKTMSSWGFIVLSFILLFVGGFVSFYKKKNHIPKANSCKNE